MSVDEKAQALSKIDELAQRLRDLANEVDSDRNGISSEQDPELATAYNILRRTIGDAAQSASALAASDGRLSAAS